MEGADEPSRAAKTLFTFNERSEIEHYATGCDADIGGTSSVHFDFDETTALPESPNQTKPSLVTRPTAKFWGNMRLGVRPELQERVRGGYAGFRSKARHSISSLFGKV